MIIIIIIIIIIIRPATLPSRKHKAFSDQTGNALTA